MKKLVLLAAVAFAAPVHASECDEETVRRVMGGGSTLILESGGAYEVEPDDAPETSRWNAGDEVLVCGGEEMINKDNGGKVHVTPPVRVCLPAGFAPRRPHPAGIANLNLLPLLCFLY